MPSPDNGKRIGLYVTPERKKKWTEYVENSPEVDTMSGLVRVGVETYMSRGGGESDRTEPESNSTTPVLDDTAVASITDTLESIDERLSVLEKEQSSADGPDLERVLHELLPEGEPRSANDGASTSELARRIGADPSDVRETLEQLDERHTFIKSATHAPPDGSEPRTVYYRVGGSP